MLASIGTFLSLSNSHKRDLEVTHSYQRFLFQWYAFILMAPILVKPEICLTEKFKNSYLL